MVHRHLPEKAELVDYASVKGFMILRPYGYAIWENIQQTSWTRVFKKTGHENVAMPVLIPESLLKKEGEHGRGLRPRGGVGHHGRQRKAGGAAVRPSHLARPCSATTGPTCIQTYRELPMLYNQWCSRRPLGKDHPPLPAHPRVLVAGGPHHPRDRRGGHGRDRAAARTATPTSAEDALAIPVVKGRKTDKEKFAGAEATYTIEAMMKDGKALQSGTSHYFGDKFSRAYDVTFTGRDNKLQYPFQTSWGMHHPPHRRHHHDPRRRQRPGAAAGHRPRAGGGRAHRPAQGGRSGRRLRRCATG